MSTSGGSNHSVDLSTVLEHYGRSAKSSLLKSSRMGWQTIRCPFHYDKHPSARVNLSKGIFWCPVDGIKGDGIHIIMAVERMTFKEACEFAERVFGASYSGLRGTDEKPKRQRWRNSLFD